MATKFATGLLHPRWLYTLPNGDVLVAESDAPQPHDKGSGLFGWVRKQVMRRAGAGVPSPDRIVLLRDAQGTGAAQMQTVFLSHLHSPFGVALIGHYLYVADTDALLRFSSAGLPEDFLTGFLTPDGRALGRPVGVALDKSGALLVADDVGNAVWRVAPRRDTALSSGRGQ